MDLRGFANLGADIGRRVTDSINSGNYDQLNRDIRRVIEDAFTNPVNSQRDSVLDGKLYREEEINKGFDRMYEEPKRETVRTEIYTKKAANTPKKGGAVAMTIIGFILAGLFGITGLGLALMMIPARTIEASAVSFFGASAGFMVPFTLGGLILGIAGVKRLGFANRYNRYNELLQGSSFCQIRQLAARVGKPERFVVRELTKMIEKGYFPEGHIDDHKTCFIGDDETYKQYILARDSAAQTAAQTEKDADNTPEAMQQVINEGKAYIKTIQTANDAIYDPVISEKLFRMEIIVKKIFDHVEQNPEQVGQLRRFMSYYMPITEKLVKAYQQMDAETVLGKNMTKAMSEIAQTLDTINEAYEKLYDSMHIDIAMDVSSDIAVLKTMFAQEGLSEDKLGGK